MSDDEKLLKFANEWANNQNPVTRATYREMYLRLYYENYLVWQQCLTKKLSRKCPQKQRTLDD